MPLDKLWIKRFNELKAYKLKHGVTHILQRESNPKLKPLSKWIRRQRERYKATYKGLKTASRLMDPEEKDLLDSIGFVWDMRGGDGTSSWTQRYQELEAFCNEYRHARVPFKYDRYPKLGEWVQNQRQQMLRKEQGKSSTLTPQRIKDLNKLGFLWKPTEIISSNNWDHFFGKLQAFKVQHGSLDLSKVLKSERDEDYAILDYWVHRQRLDYQRFLDGMKRGLSLERAEKLQALGFDWKVDRPLLDHEILNTCTVETYAPDEANRAKRVYVKTAAFRTKPIKRPQSGGTTGTSTAKKNSNGKPGISLLDSEKKWEDDGSMSEREWQSDDEGDEYGHPFHQEAPRKMPTRKRKAPNRLGVIQDYGEEDSDHLYSVDISPEVVPQEAETVAV